MTILAFATGFICCALSFVAGWKLGASEMAKWYSHHK